MNAWKEVWKLGPEGSVETRTGRKERKSKEGTERKGKGKERKERKEGTEQKGRNGEKGKGKGEGLDR